MILSQSVSCSYDLNQCVTSSSSAVDACSNWLLFYLGPDTYLEYSQKVFEPMKDLGSFSSVATSECASLSPYCDSTISDINFLYEDALEYWQISVEAFNLSGFCDVNCFNYARYSCFALEFALGKSNMALD